MGDSGRSPEEPVEGGGSTTKLLALVAASGDRVRFLLLPGRRHDGLGVERPIPDPEAGASLADKAFDGDGSRAGLDRRGAVAVIPPKTDRKRPTACDFDAYEWRHPVETFSAEPDRSRRVATRYDKIDTGFHAMIRLAGSIIARR